MFLYYVLFCILVRFSCLSTSISSRLSVDSMLNNQVSQFDYPILSYYANFLFLFSKDNVYSVYCSLLYKLPLSFNDHNGFQSIVHSFSVFREIKCLKFPLKLVRPNIASIKTFFISFLLALNELASSLSISSKLTHANSRWIRT